MRQQASVTEAMSVDLVQQKVFLKELHIDRAYLSSHLVRERRFANLVVRGKWQALRQMTADLAQLQLGEIVLVLPGYQSFRHWIIVPIS
jgi:hypothetical protein